MLSNIINILSLDVPMSILINVPNIFNGKPVLSRILIDILPI